MLNFIVWKWQDPDYDVVYTAEHVNTMASMLSRHVKQPYRLICITDDPAGIECETFPLWTDFADMKNESWKGIVNNPNIRFPSCYRRLKIFSKKTTLALGIKDGERVVSIDLDNVITDTLDPLFDRNENFVGWHSNGGKRLKGFNGSLWMFKAGTCEFLWGEFDPIESPKLAKEAEYYGSDQGWISYRMYEHSPQWTAEDGVRRYTIDLSRFPTLLSGTKIAIFCGSYKPWHKEVIERSPWIEEHYK